MTKYLYHGSHIGDINVLNPVSKLHGDNKNVVYLTDNPIYAMLYIWDPIHNLKKGKHITAWTKNGIVYYEEQFPNQLKSFYDGVKGYLYRIRLTNDCVKLGNGIYYVENPTEIMSFEEIENVYSAFCEYMQNGEMKVIPFELMTDERRKDINNIITQRIIRDKLVEKNDCDDARFFQKYFPDSWQNAHRSHNVDKPQ